ncbi:ABC transporter permease [Microbacterium marinilacus]|uniref:ABC transporter permease n=1 Tax=Microbacterium marinilacus TaxID=415209 RepID=A0ABP7B2V0_9MICO|nr:ABC transporter permease [Microbacterium marinilacus]MBY0688598.1 ABC transporter permease [Microbacterium marinilacus]
MRAVRAVSAALALPIVIVAIWWLGTRGTTNPFVPKPDLMLSDLVSVWIGPLLVEQVTPSLYRLLVGLGGAIVVGTLLGVLIGSSRVARRMTGPIFEFIRAVPPPVLLPVLLLIMGIDDRSKIFLIFLGCLWPILLNAIDGVRSVDPVLSETTASYGMTGWTRFRHFVLPAALPRIMTGIRLALPIAIILMVVSEMYAATDGIGYRVMLFKQTFQNGPMWAGILLIGLIGVVIAAVYGWIERRSLAWYHGQREREKQ